MSRIFAIVTNFDYARYVSRAVDSLLSQTKGLESITVVDDASTDDSLVVLAGYRDAIQVVSLEKNGGLANARNVAIEASGAHDGDYILNLDADDYVDRTFAEVCAGVLDATSGIGIAYTAAQTFGSRGGHVVGNPVDDGFPYVNRLNDCAVFRWEVWRDVKERNGYGFDPKMPAFVGWRFWVEAICLCGYQAAYIPEPLYHYNYRWDGMLGRAHEHGLRLYDLLYEGAEEAWPEGPPRP